MHKRVSRVQTNKKDAGRIQDKRETKRAIFIEDGSAFISDADSIFPRHRLWSGSTVICTRYSHLQDELKSRYIYKYLQNG